MPALNDRIYNMLLGLAWLGTLNANEIQRLWFPDRSAPTVEKTLTALHKADLIVPKRWSIRDDQARVTRPQLARWVLTPAGHAEVKPSDQYPAKPLKPRNAKLLPHDARTTAAIVRLIELGLPRGLTSVCVAHEVRLDPDKTRPVCDALVIMQFAATVSPLVPWSGDPASADDERLRFGIEADNHTEPLDVLRGKVRAYNQVQGDPDWQAWWHEQYGIAPDILWIAPTMARAHAIHAQWASACPGGTWRFTDDAGLAANHWHLWRARQISTGRLPLPVIVPPAHMRTAPSSPPRSSVPGAVPSVAIPPGASIPAGTPPPAHHLVVAPPSAPPAPLPLPPRPPTVSAAPQTTTAMQARSAAPSRPMTINPSAQPPARRATPAMLPPVPPRATVAATPSVEPSIGMLAVQGLVWLLKGLLWLLLAPFHLFRAVQNDGSIEAVVLFLIGAITAIIMGVWWLWFGPSDWLWHALRLLAAPWT